MIGASQFAAVSPSVSSIVVPDGSVSQADATFDSADFRLQILHFETDVIQRRPLGWRLRRIGLLEGQIDAGNVGGVELPALARNRAEVLPIPALHRRCIRNVKVDVMKSQRRLQRGIFENLDANFIGHREVDLRRPVARLDLQSGPPPSFQRFLHAAYLKADVVYGRAHRPAGRLALVQ
jgi:hypothetical protein